MAHRQTQARTHLEASRVCKHPTLPVDEAMQAPQVGHQLWARLVGQVVCVAQNDVAVQVLQLLASEPLHAACTKIRVGKVALHN